MGTPREFFFAENEKAIELIIKRLGYRSELEGNEEWLINLDLAQGCISDLDWAGLIVVSKEEYEKLTGKVFDAERYPPELIKRHGGWVRQSPDDA